LLSVDTFVVRVSRVEPDELGQLRGVVSRVADGQSVAFQTADELFAFLVDPSGGQGIDEEPTP